MKKVLAIGMVMLLFLTGSAFLFAGGQGADQAKEFIIFHYWTAGGEKEAINELFKIFERDHPDVSILENPVAGGGGANMPVSYTHLRAHET